MHLKITKVQRSLILFNLDNNKSSVTSGKRSKVAKSPDTGNIMALKKTNSNSTKRNTGTNEDNVNPNDTPNPIRDQTPSQMTIQKSPSPEMKLEEQKKDLPEDPYSFDKLSKYMTEYEQKEVKKFNKIYFFNKLERRLNGGAFEPTGKHNHGYDNDQGDYLYVKHDHINYRFEIMRQLGKGSFGVVLKCQDHKKKVAVAVKIIRNKKKLQKQGMVEVNILEHLRNNDDDDKKNIVRTKEYFYFRNHL